MLAESQAELPLPAEQVWQLAKMTTTQLYLSRRGFAYAAELPRVRQEGYEGEHRVRLFGLIPAWTHRQRFDRVDEVEHEILVRESGSPYRSGITACGSSRPDPHHAGSSTASSRARTCDASSDFMLGDPELHRRYCGACADARALSVNVT